MEIEKKSITYTMDYLGRPVDCHILLLRLDPSGLQFRLQYAKVNQVIDISWHDWGDFLVIPECRVGTPINRGTDYFRNYMYLMEVLPACDARVIAEGLNQLSPYEYYPERCDVIATVN